MVATIASAGMPVLHALWTPAAVGGAPWRCYLHSDCAGEVPDPGRMPAGCPFAPRCPHAMPRCTTDPPLTPLPDGRHVACWLY